MSGRFTKRPFGNSQCRFHLSSLFSSGYALLDRPATPARKSPRRTGAPLPVDALVMAWALGAQSPVAPLLSVPLAPRRPVGALRQAHGSPLHAGLAAVGWWGMTLPPEPGTSGVPGGYSEGANREDAGSFQRQYYLDEFVSRRKLFYRLLQQAVAVQPTPYRLIVADWGC